jgi:transglutaminase-like putative cysteine protease
LVIRKHKNCPGRYFIFRAVFFIIFLFVTSCASIQGSSSGHRDFSGFQDKSFNAETASWLNEGAQSRITPAIAQSASQINGLNRRERLYKAVDYVWKNFSFKNWYSDKAFALTADELFRNRKLGGCSDFALVSAALFRSAGIPSRLVITANVDWMPAFQKNDLLITTGHVFVEAYLEEKWYLIDPTNRLLFDGYDEAQRCYPNREYLCLRGTDYWDMGVTGVSDLNSVLRKEAVAFNIEKYKDPGYTIISLENSNSL